MNQVHQRHGENGTQRHQVPYDGAARSGEVPESQMHQHPPGGAAQLNEPEGPVPAVARSGEEVSGGIEENAPTAEATEAGEGEAQTSLSDDELADVARRVVDVLGQDNNERVQQSGFLRLMRRLAERELILRGNSFVNASEGTQPSGGNSGPGPAREEEDVNELSY